MSRSVPYAIRKLPPGPERDAAIAKHEAKAKPPHEQDVAAAAKAAKATQFSAFLFTGPGGRYRREASTFEEAVDEALDLEHSIETTRRSLLYAVVGTASIPIDEAVARLAGFPEAAIARFFDRG